MPMYYFHLYDDETLKDGDGTDLIDLGCARSYGRRGARTYVEQSWHDAARLFGMDHAGARRPRHRIVFTGAFRFREWALLAKIGGRLSPLPYRRVTLNVVYVE
jgi:hypothetical protein